ncbi:hypothetical protein VZT92_017146 [Zoarces viviparus]|uniref:Uncharacterized protein n=1 Tax=Zoarces viviparus TaxID=48416 RepID=A0AAW1ERA0_ZOAVI
MSNIYSEAKALASNLVICVIPVAKIIIGAIYRNDCPRQHYIPIYLIVEGVFSLVLAVLSCQPPEDGTPKLLSRVCTIWNTLIYLFLFCWFIAGNVWIYSIYEPNYIKNAKRAGPYCDRTLYLFAFWITTLVHILGSLYLVGCFLLSCYVCCLTDNADDDVERQQQTNEGTAC